MSDSLAGHHPRGAERVYCETCQHLWPCPGYLAQPVVRPEQEAVHAALTELRAAVLALPTEEWSDVLRLIDERLAR